VKILPNTTHHGKTHQAILRLDSFINIKELAILFIMVTGGISDAAETITKEYKLKAVFIYNFAKFVEWPAQSFATADSPIMIGVYGSNPFGNELLNTAKGRKINGRRIKIKSVNSAAAARGIHLLFVSANEVENFSPLKNSIGQGILVVGESQSISNQGGIIIFNPVGDKLHFEINMAAANLSGLKISAQLQKLATKIHR
jgi:hypothetical protein